MSKKKSTFSYKSAAQFIFTILVPITIAAAIQIYGNYSEGDPIRFMLGVLMFFALCSSIVLAIPTIQKIRHNLKEHSIYGNRK